MAIQGIFSFPGIRAAESIEGTDISGISPSSFAITMYPQDEVPALEGDLVLQNVDDQGYLNYKTVIKRCRVDSAWFVRNSGGQIVSLRLLDERWKWAFGSISGRYNFKFVKCFDAAFAVGAATDFVDPKHEKTPQQLAMLLIQAMGYPAADWNVAALPNDARPPVDWDYANPAQELAALCDLFGCRIVPVRSKGKWLIAKTGDGADLPDKYPYQDPGDGIDPVEAPDYIRIVTAPILYECRIPLVAYGFDVDKSFVDISALSYCPRVNFVPTFAYSPPTFDDISNIRVKQADGSLISPRELARAHVYKVFALTDTTPLPQLGRILLTRYILTETLVEPYLDPGSTVSRPKPAYVIGTFRSDSRPCDAGNYPPGTRLDHGLVSAKYAEEPDDVITFSITQSEDSYYTFLSFSRMLTSEDVIPTTNLVEQQQSMMLPPQLILHTAIKVRDADTWQSIRDTRVRFVGKGTQPSRKENDPTAKVLSMLKEDIQPWYRGVYAQGTTALLKTLNNQDAVQKQCDYYLDAIAKTFETVENATRRYIGIYPIDMDGAIQQVTYSISKSGSDTIASMNTEHDFEIPRYDDRRSRDARKNPENKLARAIEIAVDLTQAGFKR